MGKKPDPEHVTFKCNGEGYKGRGVTHAFCGELQKQTQDKESKINTFE